MTQSSRYQKSEDGGIIGLKMDGGRQEFEQVKNRIPETSPRRSNRQSRSSLRPCHLLWTHSWRLQVPLSHGAEHSL